jgi:hypothetical protein
MLAVMSAPIATPTRTRMPNSIHTLSIVADSSASPTKANRLSTNTRRRPIRSAMSPKNTAPRAEPKNADALSQPSCPCVRWKRVCNWSSAPLITIRS